MSKVIEAITFGNLKEEVGPEGMLGEISRREKEVNNLIHKYKAINRDSKFRWRLVFSEPIKARYGHRYSAIKEQKEHTVKALYNSGYYIAGRLKTKAYPFPYHWIKTLRKVELIQIREDYSTQWRNIAESMIEHNINLKIANQILAHLRGEEDNFFYKTKMTKPRKMSFKDYTVDDGFTMEDMKRLAREQAKDGKGTWWNGESSNYWEYGKYNRRDKSVEMWYIEEEDTYNFYASSEYAGMGNGDYYIMYSPTMAIFAEKD